MDKRLLVTLALLSFIGCISATSVICYHGTWSYYRTGNGTFKVSDVPAKLCTHYVYAFAGLDSSTNKIKSLDSYLDETLGQFAAAVALKEVNPSIKILLAIGGWNEGSAKYSTLAASATARATFVASVVELLSTYSFDGLDVDWEYPARRDSSNTADKENFALLLKELRAAFDPLGLLLTAAVSAVPSTVDTSYDVPSLSEYLDFINIMTYDFNGAWDSTVGHNAPLYTASRYAGTVYADYNVNSSVQGWISRGASPSKLALGVPFYGRTFILSSSSNTAPGSATTSTGGAAGPYTATAGFWGYNEIMEKFNEGGWTTGWDDEQQVPYAYSGTTWLSYDNEESLALKVKYAKSLGLGAIMIWSLETEDFHGVCGTQYPLLAAINNAIGSVSSSSDSSTTTTTTTTSTTTASTTTVSSSSTTASSTASSTTAASSSSSSSADADTCTSAGYIRSSTDCSIYYYCQLVNGAYVKIELNCNSGLYYDTSSGTCNYPSLVSC